ncbi:MAG: membrane protein insertase YidC [Deltaproteobacteria bacterium]|jgi:YidC/Oxa1 family membrane protein insertase|nr:membrane protein insertase YidC [Deltaproteobacteria bacterium]
MDRRVVVTMLVMMAFFMAVSYLYPLIFPPPAKAPGAGPGLSGPSGEAASREIPAEPAPSAAPGASAAPAADAEGGAPAPPEVVWTSPPADILVDTPEYLAVFTEDGARLKSFKLKKYMSWKMDSEDPDVFQELVNIPPGRGLDDDLPLRLLVANGGARLNFSHFRFGADKTSVLVSEGGSASLTFSGADSSGLMVKRVFTFRAGSYLLEQRVLLENRGGAPVKGSVGMELLGFPFSKRENRYNVVAARLDNGFLTESVDDAEDELKDLGELRQASFLGYMDQYFLSAFLFPEGAAAALVPEDDPRTLALAAREARGTTGVRLEAFRTLDLAPGASASYAFDLYYGPKDQKALDLAGHELSRTIDLGWFAFLAKPLAWLLRSFYGFVGNYGVAIILVTILIKIVLWPLTAKSYRSMKQMQKLQPLMKDLREKYKGDPQGMNREMLHLYKTFKVSPLGGCLPMILQIPFFIAFYRVLDYALELRGAPFALWIYDLSSPDRLFHFDFSIPFVAQPTGIPVLTLLMGATMIWQQKMTPVMGDPMQAKIMMMLPLIFIVALLNMPAGLVLYWLVNNILSIVQQKLINRPEK